MIEVTAAIIEKDGKIMLARRQEGQHMAGYWEFPGGKIEQGEQAETCLIRELREELSIEVKIEAFVSDTEYQYPEKHVRLICYRVSIIKGQPLLNAHDKIVWVRPQEVLHYNLAPADIPIIQNYLQQIEML